MACFLVATVHFVFIGAFVWLLQEILPRRIKRNLLRFFHFDEPER